MRLRSFLITLALDVTVMQVVQALRIMPRIPLLDRWHKSSDEGTSALYRGWKPRVWPDGLVRLDPRRPPSAKRDGLPSSWVIQRIYEGSTFFDDWSFATYPDPTHGQVQ
ncbi:uncharacterized protein EI90DRAFT_3048533 [Cantharellus anzutake]|uniref:uncharacterized protein n=1 Tax=Cantharellus anzutake TaxID=1750568 RepID=UPI001904099E|nr:uncharacterized protein EI90DRAFT_3048533 [Cantharellus anzutake]KAF8335482.1 hypothetical protein EI90DRAFT_3048533 [Cantharellus anzutake]